MAVPIPNKMPPKATTSPIPSTPSKTAVPKGKGPPKQPPTPPKPADNRPARKVFGAAVWDDGNTGEKIIIYGGSGKGKTTLASLAEKPVFIGLDDGGRKIRGRQLEHICDADGNPISNFWDLLEVLQTPALFTGYKTAVIDTVNRAQGFALPYMFSTIKHEKGGTVTNIEGYGYGKGYTHLVDTMQLLLNAIGSLARTGIDVALLVQAGAIFKANPGGEDFLEDGPGLYHSKGDPAKSVRQLFCEDMDHVVKIDYANVQAKDKKAVGETTRAIFVQPEVHFFAKSRTIAEPVIRFEDVNDDSFWRFLKEA